MIAPWADALLEAAGRALGFAYTGYVVLVLVYPTLLSVHVGVLIVLALSLRGRAPRVTWPVLLTELVYGFVNPLIYLLILQAALPIPSHPALTGAAWLLFVGVWGTRLLGGHEAARGSSAMRGHVRALLGLSLLFLVAFLAKDATAGLAYLSRSTRASPPDLLGVVWGMLTLGVGTASLYAIPAASVLHYLGAAGSPARWGEGRGFFLRPGAWRPALGALVVLVATVGGLSYRPSAATVERLLLDHRDPIVAAAQRHRVDPAVVASIVYVIHREQLSPLARHLERAAVSAWLVDLKNGFLLAGALDSSVGLAQIKPDTALAALVIYAAAALPEPEHGHLLPAVVAGLHPPSGYKQYRTLPALGREWKLPPHAVRDLRPPFPTLVDKDRIVRALFDDRQSVELCALILSLYAIQWETRDPRWAIRTRPDILATLYQLGFEKSRPKPDPRSNGFGERVLEVYRSPFIQQHFGPAA